MADAQPPLSWQHSADSQNPTISDRLPEEVVTCLENARFVRSYPYPSSPSTKQLTQFDNSSTSQPAQQTSRTSP